VWPEEEATCKAVWWDSLRLGPGDSWPRERRSLTIGRWPREAARWREVLHWPVEEVSGLWRR
jgi:hypothetical protein